MPAPTPGVCKICGGASLRVLGHTAKCADCGVLLYYPYPAGSQPAFTTNEEKLAWYGKSAHFNHANFTRMLDFAVTDERSTDPLAVLDYGGGGGQFALVCRSRFPRAAVYLVDINDDAVLEEWKPFNRRIRFADFGADLTRYDLIFLNDVFEHLDDPVGTLRLLAGKLAPRGKIFIDTPRQFWIYPLTRALSRTLHLKVLRGTVSASHLQIWSERSLGIALGASGLAVRRRTTWAEFTMPPDFYLHNMGVSNPLMRASGRAMYHAARWILRNKAVCLLERPRTG
jgi:2-polyprenyl-3-methyl-5-hydroxy-6-metoxy-1,4-benzoquinol methylase